MTNIVLCIDTTIDDTEATGSAVQAHMEVVLTSDKVSIIDTRAAEDRSKFSNMEVVLLEEVV